MRGGMAELSSLKQEAAEYGQLSLADVPRHGRVPICFALWIPEFALYMKVPTCQAQQRPEWDTNVPETCFCSPRYSSVVFSWRTRSSVRELCSEVSDVIRGCDI